jgi:anti-sigma B factor antagonist/stage II sporulation protein AA (anti-sigma F factor antagonist)
VSVAKVVVEHHNSGPVVCVRGEVDLANSEDLRAAIMPEVPTGGPGMVLDLTEATYLDSSGIRLIFDLAERLQSQGQRLVLVVSEAALVRRVVVLTKLEQAVPLADSVRDALELLDAYAC